MKKMLWPEPQISKAAATPGSYGSYKEFQMAAMEVQKEQESAQAYLVKAFPLMLKLLEHRLGSNEPLVVMRPLRYRTNEIHKSTDGNGEVRNATFVDTIKTIYPGTQLVLKGLDPSMREFLFADALNREYAVSYEDRNALMTQTDIYETIRSYLESTKGE